MKSHEHVCAAVSMSLCHYCHQDQGDKKKNPHLEMDEQW